MEVLAQDCTVRGCAPDPLTTLYSISRDRLANDAPTFADKQETFASFQLERLSASRPEIPRETLIESSFQSVPPMTCNGRAPSASPGTASLIRCGAGRAPP